MTRSSVNRWAPWVPMDPYGSVLTVIMTALFFGLHSAPVWAAPPDISVYVKVDRSDMTVGDLILVTISVRHSPGVEVNIPPLTDKLGEFMVRDIRTPEPKPDGGMMVDEVTYQLTTYFTGEIVVPPVTVVYKYTDEDGNEVVETIDTEPLNIQVNSVSPDDATEIRDIRGPVNVPVGWKYYAVWGAIALALIAAVVMAVLYWTRWRDTSAARQLEAPPRPAHEVALDKLNRIEEMDLITQGRFKEYYDHVTEAVRAYLGARYTLEALEMTTSELLKGLQPGLKNMDIREKVAFVLEDADLVKFAKHVPQENRARKALDDAKNIVTGTIPSMFLRKTESGENISTEG